MNRRGISGMDWPDATAIQSVPNIIPVTNIALKFAVFISQLPEKIDLSAARTALEKNLEVLGDEN